MAAYVDIRQLFGDGELKNLLDVCCIVEAEAIRTEDPGTANHANRLLWAKAAFTSVRSVSEPMLMALLAANKDLTVEQITGVSDANAQAKVSAAVDVFADGS